MTIELGLFPLVVIGVTIAVIVLIVMSAVWYRLGQIVDNQHRVMDSFGILTREQEQEEESHRRRRSIIA